MDNIGYMNHIELIWTPSQNGYSPTVKIKCHACRKVLVQELKKDLILDANDRYCQKVMKNLHKDWKEIHTEECEYVRMDIRDQMGMVGYVKI